MSDDPDHDPDAPAPPDADPDVPAKARRNKFEAPKPARLQDRLAGVDKRKRGVTLRAGTKMSLTNRNARELIAQYTNRGEDIVRFMLNVMEGRVQGVAGKARVDAANWLGAYVFGKPVETTVQLSMTQKQDALPNLPDDMLEEFARGLLPGNADTQAALQEARTEELMADLEAPDGRLEEEGGEQGTGQLRDASEPQGQEAKQAPARAGAPGNDAGVPGAAERARQAVTSTLRAAVAGEGAPTRDNAPTSAGSDPAPRSPLPHAPTPQQLEAVQRGLADEKAGRVADAGPFAEYADDDLEDE